MYSYRIKKISNSIRFLMFSTKSSSSLDFSLNKFIPFSGPNNRLTCSPSVCKTRI